jgi:hypothetical protein
VSFVLLAQAFMFYLPRIFWRTFSIRAGLNISDLVEAANNYKAADKFEGRKNYMRYLVQNIDQYVDDPRRYENSRQKNPLLRWFLTCIPNAGRFLGNYVVILYFFVKVMYIFNTCLQVFFISGLLGKSFWMFGFDFLYQLFSGHGWTVSSSKYFPSKLLQCC